MKLPQAIQSGIAKRMAEPSNARNILMVGEAAQNLMGSIGKSADIYKQAKDKAMLSGAVSATLGDYEKLNAYVSNKEAFDINNDQVIPKDLRNEIINKIGIDPKTIQTADGAAFVPAFEVRGLIHDYHVKKLKQRGYDNLGLDKTLSASFDQTVDQRIAKGAASIIERDVKQEIAELSAHGDMFYESAVKAGDAQQAFAHIKNMAEAGIWEPNKVAEHVNKVEGDVQYYDAVQDIVSGDAMAIREVEASLSDSQMSTQQMIDVSTRANAALDAKLKDREEKVKVASDLKLNDSLIKIGREGNLTYDYIESIRGEMTPEDSRTLINANRAARQTGAAVSDNQNIARRASVMIGRLSIPDDVPFAQRKEHVISMLHEAMGYNSEKENYEGVPQLTRGTYFALLDQVNKSDKRVIDDPRINLLIDSSYKKLTGGSREMVSFADDISVNTLSAIEYENDMIQAALNEGPSFNPQAWHDKNWIKYGTESLTNNYNTLRTRKLQAFSVLKEGRSAFEVTGMNTDVNASMDAVKQALNDEVVSTDEAVDMLNQLREIQQAQNIVEAEQEAKANER